MLGPRGPKRQSFRIAQTERFRNARVCYGACGFCPVRRTSLPAYPLLLRNQLGPWQSQASQQVGALGIPSSTTPLKSLRVQLCHDALHDSPVRAHRFRSIAVSVIREIPNARASTEDFPASSLCTSETTASALRLLACRYIGPVFRYCNSLSLALPNQLPLKLLDGTHHAQKQIRHRWILAGEDEVFLAKLHAHAALCQTMYLLAEVVQVTAEPVHRVTHPASPSRTNDSRAVS